MNKSSYGDKERSYRVFVAARAQWSSCLQGLLAFLRNDRINRHTCRIACLEFFSADDLPSRRNLDLNDLTLLLRNTNKERGNTSGRLLIVEDLSNNIIETLGSLLNIDPLFFASHIDIYQDDVTTMRPSTAALPSTTRSQNFLNLPYHRVIELGLESLEPEQGLLRDMNVPRKVAILPRLKGVKVGLARHCCSILETESKDGLWLGLILVDPSISNSYMSRPQANSNAITLNLQTWLFQGGFQDFFPCLSLSDNINSKSGFIKSSPLESLVLYWGIQKPPGFNVDCPTLLSLSSYPLRMIAAEWMTYLELMYHSIKQYEYSPDTALAALGQINVLSADMHTLDQWARRSIASTNKIRHVIEYLNYRLTKEDDIEHAAILVNDYKHIAFGLDTYSRRLEALVSIATSRIQAIDCRKSLTETVNISRLTYLALSFIPLTFVSGLFSMNEDIAPGGRHFGLYFAVSIPLCVLVFLFVHISTKISIVVATRDWLAMVIEKT